MKRIPVFLVIFTLPLAGIVATSVDEYSVVWDSPGKSFKDSMPLGNGDLGINLWTEENGDVVFLIGKSDAWTENGQLVKLGRVRVKLEPSPFAKGVVFRQVLRPKTCEIEITGGAATTLRAWVDANAPVIHIEVKSDKPVTAQAGVELWRTEQRRTNSVKGNDETARGFRELNGNPDGGVTIETDTVLPAAKDRLTWLHHNTRSIYPSVFENQHLESLLPKYHDPLLYRNFGVMMKGAGFVSVDDHTLKITKPQSSFRLDVHALTDQSKRVEDWHAALEKSVAKTDATDLETARKAHQQWWEQFWDRSWIRVSGDESAEKVTQGYAMQRWMAAGGGRGAQPMKYNGSIFTTGQEPPAGTPYDPDKGQQNADYRAWGSNYWFQNQRLLYWPMIAAGDLDLLAPFFKMYADSLPLARERTRLYFKHDGAIFPETIFFWGLPNNNDFGWGNKDVIIKNTWIRHHINSALELTAMLLDAYDTTQDLDFAKATLLPMAVELTTFFDQHWSRVDGKIRFDPSQALETYQGGVVNPTQDIAGLMHVLPRLLALPDSLTTPAQRSMWKKTLADLPPLPQGPLPTGRVGRGGEPPFGKDVPDGTQVILPAEKYGKSANVENPELYPIFPFRLFGVNLPDLELARNTCLARIFQSSTCWGQDGIQVACLGWADRAKAEVTANFTAYGGERFKWFWKPGHDWEPDLDNGGAGELILQNMLMQPRGNKVLLFPAWPKKWDVYFKLHAPKQTVIEGIWRGGKLESLKVTPESRRKDVIQMNPQ